MTSAFSWQNSVSLWPALFCTPRSYLPVTPGISWRRKWQSTPALLPGKAHGWRSLIGYSPWGRKESDTIERLHLLSLSWLQEVALAITGLWQEINSEDFCLWFCQPCSESSDQIESWTVGSRQDTPAAGYSLRESCTTLQKEKVSSGGRTVHVSSWMRTPETEGHTPFGEEIFWDKTWFLKF